MNISTSHKNHTPKNHPQKKFQDLGVKSNDASIQNPHQNKNRGQIMDTSDHVEKKAYVLWLLNYPISHFPHKNHLPKNHPQKSFKMLESKVMMRASGTHIKTKIGAKL